MKQRISRHSMLLLLACLLSVKVLALPVGKAAGKQIVIVIDPGHGGKDPGAVSKSGVQEKDVVLSIGLKLGKYVNEHYPEVKVVYTRKTDVFVPLIDRSRIANRNKADLFISLHANICGTPSIDGTETFVLGLHRSSENLDVAKKENSVILLEDNYKSTYENFDPNSSESYIMFELVQDNYLDQSLSFANDIQRQFHSRLNNANRGVKQAGFLVLRESSMPSVLVETGFLSNLSDVNKLKSEEGQALIAQSIFEALKRFMSKNGNMPQNSGQILASAAAPENSTIKPSTASPTTQEKEVILTDVKEVEVAPDSTKTETVVEKKTPQTQEKTKTDSITTATQTNANVYYSVQIGANTTPVEPSVQNFKGIKNVRREKTDKYYRYYVGKENTLEQIKPLLQQIKLKFSQAFVVCFIDGQRSIIKEEQK
jgi:N-acetylmuramoyl-L-alanine amidase